MLLGKILPLLEFKFSTSLYRDIFPHSGDLTYQVWFECITTLPSQAAGLVIRPEASTRGDPSHKINAGKPQCRGAARVLARHPKALPSILEPMLLGV